MRKLKRLLKCSMAKRWKVEKSWSTKLVLSNPEPPAKDLAQAVAAADEADADDRIIKPKSPLVFTEGFVVFRSHASC
jgi:hypothetical protein